MYVVSFALIVVSLIVIFVPPVNLSCLPEIS
nr:MAG TPA: hypothetical protein [Caudoviricetes sp.]